MELRILDGLYLVVGHVLTRCEGDCQVSGPYMVTQRSSPPGLRASYRVDFNRVAALGDVEEAENPYHLSQVSNQTVRNEIQYPNCNPHLSNLNSLSEFTDRSISNTRIPSLSSANTVHLIPREILNDYDYFNYDHIIDPSDHRVVS